MSRLFPYVCRVQDTVVREAAGIEAFHAHIGLGGHSDMRLQLDRLRLWFGGRDVVNHEDASSSWTNKEQPTPNQRM